jgi:bile acid:Na+ symporter, BASS family
VETDFAFGGAGVLVANIILAAIMFGVGLGLDLREFRRVLRAPIGPAIGLVAQFLLLPAMAFAFVRIVDVPPAVAVGVILMCCCPGGTTSNIVTHLARANVSLSIAMTTVATFLALVMTPLNLTFWGSRLPGLGDLNVALEPMSVVLSLLLVMGLPVTLGAWLQLRSPYRASQFDPWVRRVAVWGLVGLVVGAVSANLGGAAEAARIVLPVVVAVNLLALVLGYGAATIMRRPRDERRAISIEVGMQNAALALTLSIQFFPDVTEVAVVAALWGAWHLVSGLALARIWAGERLLAARMDIS